jgi:hypothetical protein
MGDIDTLAAELKNLLVGVGKDIYARFNQEDKEDLLDYTKNVAMLSIQLQREVDPAKRERTLDNLETFRNAIQLMIVRYELIAANNIEKASLEGLKVAADVIIKVLIAAV